MAKELKDPLQSASQLFDHMSVEEKVAFYRQASGLPEFDEMRRKLKLQTVEHKFNMDLKNPLSQINKIINSFNVFLALQQGAILLNLVLQGIASFFEKLKDEILGSIAKESRSSISQDQEPLPNKTAQENANKESVYDDLTPKSTREMPKELKEYYQKHQQEINESLTAIKKDGDLIMELSREINVDLLKMTNEKFKASDENFFKQDSIIKLNNQATDPSRKLTADMSTNHQANDTEGLKLIRDTKFYADNPKSLSQQLDSNDSFKQAIAAKALDKEIKALEREVTRVAAYAASLSNADKAKDPYLSAALSYAKDRIKDAKEARDEVKKKYAAQNKVIDNASKNQTSHTKKLFNIYKNTPELGVNLHAKDEEEKKKEQNQELTDKKKNEEQAVKNEVEEKQNDSFTFRPE